ncbi:hypothetical protein Tco_0274099, partial [Tanacetum coccineum]
MHSHGHPKLAKKLNDKIPKMVDEMFERVRAFIRGEVETGSAEATKAPQWDKGSTHTSWSGGQERVRGGADQENPEANSGHGKHKFPTAATPGGNTGETKP